MTEDFALSSITKKHDTNPKLEALLEAARRATWDALHGPEHLRSGRFHPHIDLSVKIDQTSHEAIVRIAAQREIEADDTSLRS